MTIRMKHPDHGFTHAYSVSEITYLTGLGWSEDKPAPKKVAVEEVVEEEETVKAQEKSKPGRPPKG